MREISGAGQVEGIGWADCLGPVQGKLQRQMNEEKRWDDKRCGNRPDSGAAILLHRTSSDNRYPFALEP